MPLQGTEDLLFGLTLRHPPQAITALRMLENNRDTNPPKKHGNIPL
jgi:hypothetical protein